MALTLAFVPGCGGESNPTQADAGAEETGATAESSVPTSTPPSRMMDLIGDDFTEANRELVTYNVQVTRRDKISAEPAGTVIEQDPQPGQEFSQRVELTVAIEPPAVPDVTELSFGEASGRLERAGFTVVEVPVFDELLADGLVVGQDPPAGAANVGEVRLDVSRRPVVKYVSDMESVSQEGAAHFEVGTASTNGEPYTHSLSIGASQYSSDATASVEYDLSRDYRRLVGDLGLEDRAVGETRYKVEIYGDERQLFSTDLALGETKAIDIDVTDVLRLELAVTRIAGSGAVVFADVRAQGLESEVGESSSTTPSQATPTS